MQTTFQFLTDDALFGATLTSNGGIKAACKMLWDASSANYGADCLVPDASLAGVWKLEATLQDVRFFSTDIRVKCTKGEYEHPTDACVPCPTGTTCPAGTTLESLPLDSGYWRAGGISLTS